jgi:hypothetical protein
MNRTFFTLCVFFAGLCNTAFAQQISQNSQISTIQVSGRVLDNEQIPIPHCTIVFTALSDSSALFTAMSDKDGNFVAALPLNRYQVEARFLGYEPYSAQLDVSGDKNLKMSDIVLDPSIITLNTATVTASTIERRADRYIVNLSSHPVSAGRSLYESLDYLPGVTTRSGISINGKSGTRVMVNNRMLNLPPEQLEQYLQNLRASDIQKVEVIADAGAEFDANASGGILKITLKRQIESGYYGSVSGDISQALKYTQSSSPSVNFSLRSGNWNIISNAYYRYMRQPDEFTENTHFLLTNMEVSNTNTTDNQIQSVGGEVSAVYDMDEKQSVGMVVNYGYNDQQTNTDGLSYTQAELMQMQYLNMNRQFNRYSRFGLSANYVRKMDEKGSTLTAMVDYLYNANDNGGQYNTYISIPSFGGVSGQDTVSYRNDIGSQNNLFTASVDFDKKWDKGRNLKLGGKFYTSALSNDILYENFLEQQWAPDPNRNDLFRYDESVSALYGTYSASWKRFSYNLGLRAEYTQVQLHSEMHDEKTRQDYLQLFPSISLSFQENQRKGHSVNLNVNRKIQRPGFSYLRPYMVPLNDFSYVVGNPELKPAKSLNITLTQTLFNKYTLVLGAAFVDDYIAQIVTPNEENPDILYYRQENISNHSQWFAAFYAPISITKWWTITPNLVALYIKDEYQIMGNKRTAQKPTYILGGMSNFILPQGWRPEITGAYVSGIAQGNMNVGQIYNLSLGCNKTFLNGKLAMTVRLNNILYPKMHIKAEEESYTKEIINNIDMKSLYVSLRYNFKSVKRVQVKKAQTGLEEEKSRL